MSLDVLYSIARLFVQNRSFLCNRHFLCKAGLPLEGCVTTLSQEAVEELSPPAPAPAGLPAPSGALPPLTFTRAVEFLDTIPGVNQRGAEMIVAEIGIDMARFGTASRLAA